MDLASFQLLLTSHGQEALQAAQSLEPKEADYLPHFQRLAKEYPRELAQAALETAILRREASIKFPQAEEMYFTREALQQSSSFAVSTYRAERYRPFDALLDLGCSIGGDTISLANLAPTVGIDIQPLRLAIAQANAQSLGVADQVEFILTDLEDSLPLRAVVGTGTFFDPARRSGGKRSYSVREYVPKLDIIQDWLPRLPHLGVKISPGVRLSEIEHWEAELEFISVHGELKEAVLWFGALKSAPKKATVLPGPYSIVPDGYRVPLALSQPLQFLVEPDPAVLRAGLVAALGRRLGAFQLDPAIGYLTYQHITTSPFARVWRIEDWMPFSVKRLRSYLRERGVGQITVKKRGSPLQPEELMGMLKLRGENQRVVVLTQLAGDPIAIICYPYQKP
jgi:hypothetical protein